MDKPKYEILNYENKSVICTNLNDAELSYSFLVTDANRFPALFIRALAYQLAADLCQPLKGRLDLQGGLIQLFAQMIDFARMENSNQENAPVNKTSDFVSIRN